MARILVVDDDDDVRTYLAQALALAGHDVEEAIHGQAALDRVASRSFHAVLTDLKMPRMGGMELLRRLKVEQPEIEVVVLTAHGSVENAVEAMREGAFDYLQKPVGSPAELRIVMERALERRQLRDRAAAAVVEGPRLTWGAPAMTPVEAALRKVAPTQATVLLTGESGTGKEVAARAVHAWSDRRAGPFVVVNCAALSAQLLESELFGHEAGAFTGAAERRRGRLELADGGTFFLDEVGELDPGLQAKLLRVLQERRFERVGGNTTIDVDVRWIAATNRDLDEARAEGGFRDDLYHRLAVFPVHLPPLRDRPQDVVPLAEALLAEVAAQLGRPGLSLAEDALGALRTAPWSGNVRELRNTLERAAILADTDVLDAEALSPARAAGRATWSSGAVPTLEEAERELVSRALALYEGNRRKAAEHLGIGLRTLYDKLKRWEEG